MRSFQRRLPDFESRGLQVVGVSVDPPEINRDHRRSLGLTFPLLSDETGEVLRRYDLLHAAGSPHKADISRPAEFLVDRSGAVSWRNLTGSAVVRADPQDVLNRFDGTDDAAHLRVP